MVGVWYDMTWHGRGMVWHGMTWHGMDMVCDDMEGV